MRDTGSTNPLDLILWPRGLIERAHEGLAAGERFALLVRHADRPPITSGMSDTEIAQLPLTKHGLRQASSFG